MAFFGSVKVLSTHKSLLKKIGCVFRPFVHSFHFFEMPKGFMGIHENVTVFLIRNWPWNTDYLQPSNKLYLLENTLVGYLLRKRN